MAVLMIGRIEPMRNGESSVAATPVGPNHFRVAIGRTAPMVALVGGTARGWLPWPRTACGQKGALVPRPGDRPDAAARPLRCQFESQRWRVEGTDPSEQRRATDVHRRHPCYYPSFTYGPAAMTLPGSPYIDWRGDDLFVEDCSGRRPRLGRYGTPLYVYSRAAMRSARWPAIPAGIEGPTPTWSATPSRPIPIWPCCRPSREAGCGFDIVSGGELRARAGGRRRSGEGGVLRRRQDAGRDGGRRSRPVCAASTSRAKRSSTCCPQVAMPNRGVPRRHQPAGQSRRRRGRRTHTSRRG